MLGDTGIAITGVSEEKAEHRKYDGKATEGGEEDKAKAQDDSQRTPKIGLGSCSPRESRGGKTPPKGRGKVRNRRRYEGANTKRCSAKIKNKKLTRMQSCSGELGSIKGSKRMATEKESSPGREEKRNTKARRVSTEVNAGNVDGQKSTGVRARILEGQARL